MKRRGPALRRSTSGPHRAIGLDLGATSVRAASLSVTGNDGQPSARLERVASAALPRGVVVNGTVEDPTTLTGALKALWQANDFGSTSVILGVANPQVVVRDLRIPFLDPQQQAKALPFQARDVIALPINEVILDFVPLGPPDPATGLVDGLLVATPRGPVLAAVGAVERAGLKVARVDLSSFAVLRSVAQEDLEVEAVVDLGAHLTTIVVHHRGVPRLVRTLARGGQELTDRLADRLALSPEEAEAAKRAHGLSDPQDPASSALREAIRPLISEIRSSVNYFRSSNSGARLERVALTGGGAGLPGLAETVAEQVGAPTTVANPVQHVDGGLGAAGRPDWWDKATAPSTGGSHAAATSLSVGLALGGAA